MAASMSDYGPCSDRRPCRWLLAAESYFEDVLTSPARPRSLSGMAAVTCDQSFETPRLLAPRGDHEVQGPVGPEVVELPCLKVGFANSNAHADPADRVAVGFRNSIASRKAPQNALEKRRSSSPATTR